MTCDAERERANSVYPYNTILRLRRPHQTEDIYRA